MHQIRITVYVSIAHSRLLAIPNDDNQILSLGVHFIHQWLKEIVCNYLDHSPILEILIHYQSFIVLVILYFSRVHPTQL